MVLANKVRNLVQEESALSVISLEQVCGLHSFDHVLVLVLGPNVFVVEGAADARLQDQIFVLTNGLRVQAFHRNVQSKEPCLDLFYHQGCLSENVDINTFLKAPLSLL